jgi:hypothetical protein
VLEHDASGFVYFAVDDTPLDVALARWAQEIVPAVREAVAAQLGNLVILRLAACRENFVSVR